MTELPKWQYITQGGSVGEQLSNAIRAMDAGCPWVQLRMKDADEQSILETALELREYSHKKGSLLFINDHPRIARQCHADGLHLGTGDMPPSVARPLLKKDIIIGGTANTFRDILRLQRQGVDYIGLGPFRFTETKKHLSPTLGLEGYATIMRQMETHSIRIPVFAIGGITRRDVPPIMETGVYGIALSGLLTREANKEELVGFLNDIG